MEKRENMIPEQRVGNQLDTFNSVTASSEEEARQLFLLAVNRLLDVNVWNKISGKLSSTFRLTDEKGSEIDGPARPGNHFKIDIPGPGPASGEGNDWVKVEALDDKRNPSGKNESVTLRVRPTADPENTEKDTAHFFDEAATSSFRVERDGNTVTASVHGRNEQPNTDVEKTSDKMRNALVGTGAVAGFSAPQWKALVNGLLDTSVRTDSD